MLMNTKTVPATSNLLLCKDHTASIDDQEGKVCYHPILPMASPFHSNGVNLLDPDAVFYSYLSHCHRRVRAGSTGGRLAPHFRQRQGGTVGGNPDRKSVCVFVIPSSFLSSSCSSLVSIWINP
uniref:Uncharacterized protein n=1 Tax=Cucumis sativus TaxID=3659 RepID=A0A0A0KSG2_CUCSA